MMITITMMMLMITDDVSISAWNAGTAEYEPPRVAEDDDKMMGDDEDEDEEDDADNDDHGGDDDGHDDDDSDCGDSNYDSSDEGRCQY